MTLCLISSRALRSPSLALHNECRRYELEILPDLEAYVEHQAATNAYDLEANLACLKLYQASLWLSLTFRIRVRVRTD